MSTTIGRMADRQFCGRQRHALHIGRSVHDAANAWGRMRLVDAAQPIGMIPGTQGYAEHALALVSQYEAVAFENKFAALLHLLPMAPAQVLDIGAGSGADAAWFAARGHTVVAVEPVQALRVAAMNLHRTPCIEWVDDQLPMLTRVCQAGRRFDLVSLMAVWMHLDAVERESAMAVLAGLLDPDGVLLLSLRHGPIPPDRRMFDVSPQETIALAMQHGLNCVSQCRGESIQAANRSAGVTWTSLAFRQGGRCPNL